MSEISADNEAYIHLPPRPDGAIGSPGNSVSELDLDRYKLPGKPNSATEMDLHKIWSAMLSDGVEFVAPVLKKKVPPGLIGAGANIPTPTLSPRAVLTPRLHAMRETSKNWSGGYILPTHGDNFTRVAGSWVVPDVTTGSSEDETNLDQPGFQHHGERLGHRCSIWVGLDGWKRWADSMPQLGTEHSENGSHRFWFQWWLPESKRFQHYVDGIDLLPGDLVICNLSVVLDQRSAGSSVGRNSPGSVVRFHFLRVRDNNGSIDKKFTAIEIDGERPLRGSSVQWVLEQPAASYIDGNNEPRVAGMHPILNFGTVELLSFAARGADSANPAQTRSYSAQQMRLVSMLVTRSNPRRSARVSHAVRLPDGGLIKVVYQ